MSNSSIKSALLSLGLSEHDSVVYLALAQLGATTSGPLITKTQLHRNVVYTSLEHLVDLKYVLETQERGKKRFVVADPSIITRDFEEKLTVANEVSKEISTIAELESQEISIHEGNEEYLTLLTGLIRMLPKGGTKYVLGTGGEDFMGITMRPIWKKYHKVAKNRGIKIKMIAYESQRQAIANDIEKEGIYEVCYLPDEIENPAGTHIYPEAGVILNIIYSTPNQPVTAVRIKNKNLVQGQLNLFNKLWKIAKK
ncbi:MAG: helix-turn-helix domain-containing protein [Candidatus Uhrbacteria bacterium]